MNFAEGYNRDSNGWIIFPRDVEYRSNMFFPDEVMSHPAKMNLWLQKSIIDYVSKPGEVLLDPTSGTGSLLIGCLDGRRAILLEIEDGYHKLQQQAVQNMESVYPQTTGLATLIQGDCRLLLPIPCNHIMFSPPYAQAMNIKKVREVKEGRDDFFAKLDAQMLAYSKSQRNISKLNTFYYNKEMGRVYKLCYDSLLPGGSLTIIIKDRINNGERTYLSDYVNNICKEIGFTRTEWYKWLSPGSSFTNVRRANNETVVDDEDIIIFWK